jgi:GntR family transcriptional repressor for pyruvate dehydrogenase complex
MEKQNVLDKLNKVDIQKPSDIILRQIRELISSGMLRPGDMLPSERELSERFGVGRSHVREAIKKLEFYGILKTKPQSGTFVASLGVKALEGIIKNVIDLEKDDFNSLLDTRSLLEIHAARLTAKKGTDEEIDDLVEAQEEFKREVENGKSGLDFDLSIHLKIAEYSKNSVLRSLIALIIPDIIEFSKNLHTCKEGRYLVAMKEHEEIINAIKNRDADQAAKAMRTHLERTLEVTKKAYAENK